MNILTIVRLSILLSAFLLFFIQPLVTNFLLPYFGGAYTVWSGVVFFFTSSLLLGYLYAGLLIHWPRSVAVPLHVSLVGLAILSIVLQVIHNGVPLLEMAHPDATKPGLSLLLSLVSMVWLPTFILASTSIVGQFLYGAVTHEEPYPLYRLSNIGSAVGLLSYPLLFETISGKVMHAWLWAGLFVMCCGLLSWAVLSVWPRTQVVSISNRTRIPFLRGLTLILYAAIPAFFMVALTEYLAKSVASFPLLWVVPLFLYLMSFVVAFGYTNRLISNGSVYLALLFLMTAQVLLVSAGQSAEMYVWFAGCALVAFFATAVYFHQCVYQLRPPKESLGQFYLLLTVGGSAGTAFMSFGIPVLLKVQIELLLLFAGLIFWLGFVVMYRLRSVFPWTFGLQVYGFIGIVCFMVALLPLAVVIEGLKNNIASERNFYGVLSVLEETVELDGEIFSLRKLQNGAIDHGAQVLDSDVYSRAAISYYGPGSGMAVAVSEQLAMGKKPRIAVVGLGVGVINGYCDQAQSIEYIEINPAVQHIAETYFEYVSLCPEKTTVHIGDGRLWFEALLQEEQGIYDIIVLDAFSDDAIPAYLLTEEAVRDVYAPLLTTDGMIAFHISNRFLNLRPPLAGSIQVAQLEPVAVDVGTFNEIQHPSSWILGVPKNRVESVLDNDSASLYSGAVIQWSDNNNSVFSVLSPKGSFVQ